MRRVIDTSPPAGDPVEQLDGTTAEERAAFDRSIELGAGLGLRPAYPLPPGPAEHCPHGARCRRCAIYDGDWVDFGPSPI